MTEASSTTDRLHDLAKSGFADGCTYDRNRPDYTPEAVDEVVRMLLENQDERCGDIMTGATCGTGDAHSSGTPDLAFGFCEGSDCDFLELGAGTGIMTRHLRKRLPSNRTFLASEPMIDMLHTLKKKCPDVRAENFFAESIPLPDNSVQGIVAAQCFQWFANETALREIHRVLTPNGNIVLIWNYRDVRVDWVRTLNDMITCQRSDEPRYMYINECWKWPIDTFHGIRFKVRKKMTRDSIQYTMDSLIDCFGSVSSMVDERSRYLLGIRDFLDTNPATANKTHFDMPMYTDILHYVKVT